MEDKQYLFGTPAMFSELEKKVILIVREGRQFVGILKSLDQFGNIALDETSERFCLDSCYTDMYIGAFVIRGENVVLVGVYDEVMREMPENMEEVSCEEFLLREEKFGGNVMHRWKALDAEVL